MQKYDKFPSTHNKIEKRKQDVKRELEESLIEERHKNKHINDKADKKEEYEEAADIIREFEELISAN